jgi:lipid-binding SYLF domain-containing protein
MRGRAAVVWMYIVPVAIVNGMLRDMALAPYLGDPTARAISCVTLAAAVLAIARMSIAWIGPPTAGAAWMVGVIWLNLTLALEFLVGHYVFGTPWAALRADYNIFAGRLWVLVLAAALAGPRIMFRPPPSRTDQTFGLVAAAALALLTLSAAPSAIFLTGEEDDLLYNAAAVFEYVTVQTAPAIPASVLLRAHGLAIFPRTVLDGARFAGKGVMSARGATPTEWTPPAAIAIEGVIPLQLESPEADLILVAQTQRGLDYLVQARFANPVAPPIAAGVLGADSGGRMNADILAYMRFGNYLAGVTVGDWSIRELKADNAIRYGRPYSTEAIVRGAGFFHLPPAARAWRNAIAAYFREMS